MAQTPNIRTPTARGKLPVRGKPYYEQVERGLFLGYRQSKTMGAWVVRWLAARQTYTVETLARAELTPRTADGVEVLNYEQAKSAARERWRRWREDEHGTRREVVTVRDAFDRYLAEREGQARRLDTLRSFANNDILPILGDVRLDELSADAIRDWHRKLAERPALVVQP